MGGISVFRSFWHFVYAPYHDEENPCQSRKTEKYPRSVYVQKRQSPVDKRDEASARKHKQYGKIHGCQKNEGKCHAEQIVSESGIALTALQGAKSALQRAQSGRGIGYEHQQPRNQHGCAVIERYIIKKFLYELYCVRCEDAAGKANYAQGAFIAVAQHGVQTDEQGEGRHCKIIRKGSGSRIESVALVNTQKLSYKSNKSFRNL